MLVLEYKVKGKKAQYVAIDDAIRTTQFIRNKAVRYWMDADKELKVDKFALNKYSTQLRKEFPFVADLNSMAVQSAAERGWFAISRFSDNCKSKKAGKKGYPRFQKDCRSVEYKTSGWQLHQTKRRITFTDKKSIGELKLLGKWDIQSYDVKNIKRIRLIRRADGYYAQFCIGIDAVDIQPKTGLEIGLDVGIESFYSDSNGHREPNPKFLRKAETSIKQSQRRIYKKVKGSSGRRKARKVYAKRHLTVSRQRIEHAKRVARCVIKSNDLVAYEDLRVSNMVKNHCLAKSISDASWYLFRQWLEYFAVKFDKLAIAVPPHYTSQKCSSCGVIVKKSLSTRTHNCSCGCSLHRDVNAAVNILNLAKTRGGHPQSNAVGVGISTLVGASQKRANSDVDYRIPVALARGVSNLDFAQWKNPQTRKPRNIFVIGFNPEEQVFNLPEVQQNAEKLKTPDTVLFDEGSRTEFGLISAEFNQGKTITTEVQNRQLTVEGLFKLGPSFGADGNLITSDLNFLRLFKDKRTKGLIDVGMIKLQPGTNTKKVIENLRRTLPEDVKILSKQEFMDFEINYWDSSSPTGFIFNLGTAMGFIVGTVIVYQILYSDVSDHLAEYATLKAMGYTDAYLLLVVFQEALILAILGYIPGFSISLLVYAGARNATLLPMFMSIGRAILVLALTVLMCFISGAIAVRKLRAADPADIF